MNLFSRTTRFVFLFCCITGSLHAQRDLYGKILYERDDRPVASASVTLLNNHSGNISDQSGNFRLHIPVNRYNDTIVISSIGYESIYIPVKQAMNKKEFKLVEASKNLSTVIVKYNKEQVLGDKLENSACFMSWNTHGSGGEIGRIFRLNHKEYKVNKIRFKANSFCDTCLVRLRIRKVVNGHPEDELLKDSITIFVRPINMNSKSPEFDLSKYDLILKEKEIFVGMELVNCVSPANTRECSFNFVGTEKGTYIYRSRRKDGWGETAPDDYSIFLKLFVGY